MQKEDILESMKENRKHLGCYTPFQDSSRPGVQVWGPEFRGWIRWTRLQQVGHCTNSAFMSSI